MAFGDVGEAAPLVYVCEFCGEEFASSNERFSHYFDCEMRDDIDYDREKEELMMPWAVMMDSSRDTRRSPP